VFNLTVFGGGFLESFDFRAEYELLAFENALDRGHHFSANRLKLRAQI